jgi:hypothetical protein
MRVYLAGAIGFDCAQPMAPARKRIELSQNPRRVKGCTAERSRRKIGFSGVLSVNQLNWRYEGAVSLELCFALIATILAVVNLQSRGSQGLRLAHRAFQVIGLRQVQR